MNCPHCEHHRNQLEAKRPADGVIEWTNARSVRIEMALPPELHATVATCPCDCHTPARIVGALPKVGVAA